MNKLFGGLVVQFREFFKGLGPTKKYSVIAVAIIALFVVLSLYMMVAGVDYVPLLTNIPSEQVTTIVAKLNEKNVPFKLEDNGKSISVPKSLLHTTEMTLMAEIGSSKMGQVGLEIFEKQDFGVSSYAQKVNYQRALQGELTRAINTLSSIKQSKVILALPAKKTFLEEGHKASASVVVELYPGKELGPDQIRGIRYLVANAVEGMDPDSVTVLDERGKILTRQGEGAAGPSSEILDLKSKLERDMEIRIEQILGKVVGTTKVIAKVDATLNHRIISSVEEVVDPEKSAIRSQVTEEETLDGQRTNPSGIPGSRSNLPGAEDAGQVGFKQDVKKEIKNTNYDIPKTVRNVKESAGNLERISVAVVVDGIASVEKKDDGATESKWQARSAEEIQKYEALVKSAIGFNAARGDSVKIESIQFQPEDFAESDRLITKLEQKELLHALGKWGLIVFLLVLTFFIVVRPFMQWITDSYQHTVEEMLPRTIEELEELQQVDNTLPGMSTALPLMSDNIDPDKAESELLRDRIMSLVEKDEEKATNAFGMWLVRKDN